MVHQAIEMLDAQTVQIEALTEGLSSTAEKTDYTAEEVVRTRREVSGGIRPAFEDHVATGSLSLTSPISR